MVRMLQAGIYSVLRPLRTPNRPIHFQLEPMVGCNLKCRTCTVPSYSETKRMTIGRFRHIFDQIRPLKIALSGAGEPFLNSDMFEIIRYARENGASVLTSTNFTVTRRRLQEFIDSGLNLLKISLDAATPETYEKIRGRDRFEAICEDIRTLNELKSGAGSPTPALRLQFVIQRDNIHELSLLPRLAKELNADSIYLQPLMTEMIPERRDGLTEGVDQETLECELRSAGREASRLGLGTNVPLLLRNLRHYWQLRYAEDTVNPPPDRVCLLPWFSLYITVDGGVRPCCSFGDSESLFLGNLLEQSIEEIWNGPAYVELRRKAKERRLDYGVCRQCIPNKLRDFVALRSVLPGFLGRGSGTRGARC